MKVLISIIFYKHFKNPFSQEPDSNYTYVTNLVILFWGEASAQHFQDDIANKPKHKRC